MPGPHQANPPKRETTLLEEHIIATDAQGIKHKDGVASSSGLKHRAFTPASDIKEIGLKQRLQIKSYSQEQQTYIQHPTAAPVSAAAATIHAHNVKDCHQHHKQPPYHQYSHSSAPRTTGLPKTSLLDFRKHKHGRYFHFQPPSAAASTAESFTSSASVISVSENSQVYCHNMPQHPSESAPALNAAPMPAFTDNKMLYFSQPSAQSQQQISTLSSASNENSNTAPQTNFAYNNSKFNYNPPTRADTQSLHSTKHSAPMHYQQHQQSLPSGPAPMPQYQNGYYQHPPAPRAGQAYHSATAAAAHNSREPGVPLYMRPGRLSLSTSTSPTAPKGSVFMQIPGRPLTAEEKEIKRKVSHSAIEKRRRERTNSVLSELQNIVPGLSKPGKIQKLEILEAAAKYIRQLTASAGVRKQTSSKQHHGLNKHTQQMQCHDQGFQEGSQNCHHDYQPRVNQHHQPKTFDKLSPFHSHSRILERAVSDEPLDQQHIAIATPTSVYYNMSADESTDEATSNSQSRPLAASSSSTSSASSTLPADPSSMKVNFLLC